VRYLAVAAAALPLLAGCSSHWQTFRANRVTVRYPKTWFATRSALTPVISPRQVLAVASFRLPNGPGGADGCQPKEALDRLPPDGALLFGWEYTGRGEANVHDFPAQPEHFRLTSKVGFECLGPSYVLRFSDARRFFQIHVVLGPRAGVTTRATVLRILDTFRARPRPPREPTSRGS
jgi:hypothetical protein